MIAVIRMKLIRAVGAFVIVATAAAVAMPSTMVSAGTHDDPNGPGGSAFAPGGQSPEPAPAPTSGAGGESALSNREDEESGDQTDGDGESNGPGPGDQSDGDSQPAATNEDSGDQSGSDSHSASVNIESGDPSDASDSSEPVASESVQDGNFIVDSAQAGDLNGWVAEIIASWINNVYDAAPLDELVDTDGDGTGDTAFGDVIGQIVTILMDPDSTGDDIQTARDLAQAISRHLRAND